MQAAPNFVPLSQVATVLDWLFKLRDSDQERAFALTGIAFNRIPKWGERFGTQVRPMFDTFGEGLAATLRTSDLVARDGTVFWVLSATSDSNVLFERVRDYSVEHSGELGAVLGFQVRGFKLPFAAVGDSARAVLDELRVKGLNWLPAVHHHEQAPSAE